MRRTEKGRVGAFFRKLNRPSNRVAIIVYATTLVVCPLALISAALGYGEGVLAGIAYAICACLLLYALVISVPPVVRFVRKLWHVAGRYAFIRSLLKNYEFRTIFFAACSFFANIAYTVFLCLMAWHTHSEWYSALALYYILLTTARGVLLGQNMHDEKNYKDDPVRLHLRKTASYRYCGVMLIVMTLVLALAIVRMIVEGEGFRVPSGAIYAYAAVALYRLVVSVYNSLRAKRSDDMAVRAVRNINFATALVAWLSLQTAWFAAFPPSFDPSPWNGVVGGLICTIIVALGVYMLLFSAFVKKRLTAYGSVRRKHAEERQTPGYNRADYDAEYPNTVHDLPVQEGATAFSDEAEKSDRPQTL